jgi:Uma2 family endonuclease
MMTAEAYERLALAEPSVPWELHEGRLREKPAMSIGHNRTAMNLTRQLHLQLDPVRFEVRTRFRASPQGRNDVRHSRCLCCSKRAER